MNHYCKGDSQSIRHSDRQKDEVNVCGLHLNYMFSYSNPKLFHLIFIIICNHVRVNLYYAFMKY